MGQDTSRKLQDQMNKIMDKKENGYNSRTKYHEKNFSFM